MARAAGGGRRRDPHRGVPEICARSARDLRETIEPTRLRVQDLDEAEVRAAIGDFEKFAGKPAEKGKRAREVRHLPDAATPLPDWRTASE